MVIAHNLLALNANRYQGINEIKQKKSMFKLASGYKINNAADNAAGLSISEKMRSQIRGLDQASANAMNGISLIQTADGGLSEDHSILQRMRELTVQAANDTNTEIDRGAIQEEINQLSNELDRIADQTEFNSRKLLDGSFFVSTDSAALKKIEEYLKGTLINDAFSQIKDATGLSINNSATLDVQFKDLGSSAVATMGSWNGGSSFYLNINTNFLTDSTAYGESGPVAGGILFDRLITHEVTHAVMRHNASPTMDIPMWFTEGLAEAVPGASDYRFGDGAAFAENSKSYAADIMSDFNFIENETGYNAYPAGYLAVSYLYNYANDGGATFKSMLSKMDTDFETMISDNYGKTYSDLVSEMKASAAADISNFLINDCKIDFSDGNGDALHEDVVSEDIIAQSGTSQAISAGTETISITSAMQNLTINWPDISTLSPFHLQVGANENQFITISIGNMSSEALLGSAGVTVLSHSGAENSLTTIDDAIKKVSSDRSSLGAVQNRLEHIISNLDSTSENTSYAESRIRDVDMAEEMVNYSKYNILLQASQSMLAQANRQPQSILQLLE